MRWVVWILCLSLLSIALKNSEQGLAGDAPLYSSISKNMVESGNYFQMDAAVPDFKPNYNEHPHLSFWIQAAIFKVFGFHDWSARILGHLYYILFLLLFFFSLSAMVSEAAAVIGILILWIQPHFSATFSSFLLDPGALFWGAAFLITLSQAFRYNSWKYSTFSGLCLALCALTKGLTFLGFGLPAVYLLILHIYSPQKGTSTISKTELFWQTIRHSTFCLAIFFTVIFVYLYTLSHSPGKHFIEFYWLSQVSRRFSNIWKFESLFLKEFWWPLLKDSLGFLLIIPLAFFNQRKKLKSIGAPLLLFLSFVLSYAPAHRFGGQYLIMFLPSIAWLGAIGLERWIKSTHYLVSATQLASIVAFLVLQYSGLQIHGSPPSLSLKVLKESLDNSKHENNLVVLDTTPRYPDFLTASRLVWYSGARVTYTGVGNSPWPPNNYRSHYLYSPDNGKISQAHVNKLHSQGWCTIYQNKNSVLFRNCKT